MGDVGPYVRVERVVDRENFAWASAIFKRSGLTRVKKKAILTISESSTILRGAMFEGLKMTNGFEIEGLAARQARRHFAYVCHMTLDTRPSLVFFLPVKKAERGLGMRLVCDSVALRTL